METQQTARSKRTTTKKKATVKKRKRLRGSLAAEALASRKTCVFFVYENQVLLEHYYLPEDLELRIGKFVEYYNHERYHESLNNLAPADVFYGRGQQILNRRETIKCETSH